METRVQINASKNEMSKLFANGISELADIRFYEFISESCCRALIRHSDTINLKENSTYSLAGLKKRCEK